MRRGTLVAVVAGLCLLAGSIAVAQENLRVLSETVGGAPAGEMMSEKPLPASGRQQTEFGGSKWLYQVRHIDPSNHG